MCGYKKKVMIIISFFVDPQDRKMAQLYGKWTGGGLSDQIRKKVGNSHGKKIQNHGR